MTGLVDQTTDAPETPDQSPISPNSLQPGESPLPLSASTPERPITRQQRSSSRIEERKKRTTTVKQTPPHKKKPPPVSNKSLRPKKSDAEKVVARQKSKKLGCIPEEDEDQRESYVAGNVTFHPLFRPMNADPLEFGTAEYATYVMVSTISIIREIGRPRAVF